MFFPPPPQDDVLLSVVSQEDALFSTSNCIICQEEISISQNPPLSNIPQDVCAHFRLSTCQSCADSWIQEMISQHQKQEIQVSCPSVGCSTKLNISAIAPLLVAQCPKMDNELQQIYLRTKSDVIRCPNSGCKYAGFILDSYQRQGCEDPLACEGCGFKWKLPYSGYRFWHIQMHMRELGSWLYRVLRTKSCPSCTAPIQKNGGCSHMSCQKCQSDFCWLCMKLRHNHFTLMCRSILLSKVFFLSSPIILLLKRLGFFKLYKEYQPIPPNKGWKDIVLYPFRRIAQVSRITGYVCFAISSCVIVYGTAMMQAFLKDGIDLDLNRLKKNLDNIMFSFRNYFRRRRGEVEEQKQPKYRRELDNKMWKMSGILIVLSAAFIKRYGRRNEAILVLGSGSIIGTFITSGFLLSL